VVVEQTLEADRIVLDMPEAHPGPACLLLSAEGAMVPLVGREWAEVWPSVERAERAAARQARRERRARRTSEVLVEAAPAPVRTLLPGGKAHPPPATHPWKRLTLPAGARHNLTQRAARE
jgi:hypothetical protein